MRRPDLWLLLCCLPFLLLSGCRAGEPAEPRLNAGKALLEQGELDKALAELSAAIAADPQLREAYLLRGDVFYRQRQPERAVGDYARALELAADADGFFKLGLANAQRGDYDQAIAAFTKASAGGELGAEKQARIVDAYLERGKALLQKASAGGGAERLADYRLYEKALADFSEAIALDPKSVIAYRLRGEAFLTTGQTHKALDDCQAMMALAPQSAEGYRLCAAVYADDGKLAEARADCDRAIALAPTDPGAFLQRGRLAMAEGRFPEALADFTQALTLEPMKAAGYLARGETNLTAGRFLEAAVDFNKAVELEAENPEVYLARGRARLSQAQRALVWEEGDAPRLIDQANRPLLEGAIADFTQALKLERNTKTAYRRRGEAHLLLGDLVRAEDDFHWALWQDRSDFQAYKARGDLAMLRKDFDKAIEDYTEAIDYSNNKFVGAFLARARAFEASGQADPAAQDRERAAKLRAASK